METKNQIVMETKGHICSDGDQEPDLPAHVFVRLASQTLPFCGSLSDDFLPTASTMRLADSRLERTGIWLRRRTRRGMAMAPKAVRRLWIFVASICGGFDGDCEV
ncbi:hypothetical protein Droror1_Dr00025789 [Drosera rotundifolia]